MPASLVEIMVILLLILLNGVFSMSETAFVSARKTRLQQRADTGDAFEWAGWRFDVMDMDGRRVDKVLAKPLRPPQSASQQQ
jgi:CBS domain containing-hemolysin-like protein